MQIRRAQRENMSEQRLLQHCIALLQDGYPEETAPIADTELSEQVATQLTLSRKYDFNNDQDRFGFVHAAWLFGPDFQQRIPSFRALFARTDLTPVEKAQVLESLVVTYFEALQS